MTNIKTPEELQKILSESIPDWDGQIREKFNEAATGMARQLQYDFCINFGEFPECAIDTFIDELTMLGYRVFKKERTYQHDGWEQWVNIQWNYEPK